MNLYTAQQLAEAYKTGVKHERAWSKGTNMKDLPPSRDEYLASVQPVDGWIRVEDEKPIQEKFVLLYNGFWTGVGRYCPIDDSSGYMDWQDETSEYISPLPTHWRPLPEPPLPTNKINNNE